MSHFSSQKCSLLKIREFNWPGNNFPSKVSALPLGYCLPCVQFIVLEKSVLRERFVHDTEILTLARIVCSRSARAEYNEFGVCGSTRVKYNGLSVYGSTGVECGSNAKINIFRSNVGVSRKSPDFMRTSRFHENVEDFLKKIFPQERFLQNDRLDTRKTVS